eukprot:TRINITY_DN56370_c0_g1_i1.p2 TRINITY_DN56370_c0_g1~~TRINITY_DN56370_c0_g1_i1.p2  ORF type:complete len:197 (+),score=48.39 TRINITY_DN56370_c0_g1_i1:123-713(+)
MSHVRGATYRVPGSTVPYQFSKYNLPNFHQKVSAHGIVNTANAAISKKMDREGQALWRWRRGMIRHFDVGLAHAQARKTMYNAEWMQKLRQHLHELLNYRTVILMEEQALLADRYGHDQVRNVIGRAESRSAQENPQEYWARRDGDARPKLVRAYRHRPERDQPVSYLRPQGQHAYNLSFVAGQQRGTQLDQGVEA